MIGVSSSCAFLARSHTTKAITSETCYLFRLLLLLITLKFPLVADFFQVDSFFLNNDLRRRKKWLLLPLILVIIFEFGFYIHKSALSYIFFPFFSVLFVRPNEYRSIDPFHHKDTISSTTFRVLLLNQEIVANVSQTIRSLVETII